MNYGEIYKEFLCKTGIKESLINDYRPAEPLYTDLECFIPNAIHVWFNGGGKVIYISETPTKS
jgi:hypothetical protein